MAFKAHLPTYFSLPDVELVAVADTNEEKAKRASDIFKVSKYYLDFEKMISEENLDAVSVCTPPKLHRDVVVTAAMSGINILCEKPFSSSVREARDMIMAAERNDVILMTGYNLRFHKPYFQIKKLIDQGRLGKIILVRGFFASHMPNKEYALNSNGGGVLLDIGCHCLDLLRWFGGEIKTVYANLMAIRETEVDEVASISLEFHEKAFGEAYASWLVPQTFHQLMVHGTSGMSIAEPTYMRLIQRDTLLSSSAQEAICKPLWKVFVSRLGASRAAASMRMLIEAVVPIKKREVYSQSYCEEITHFVDCVIHRKKPLVTGDDGIKVLKLVEAVRRSAKEGKRIPIEE